MAGCRDTPDAQLPSSAHYAAATKAVAGLSTYADKIAPALAPEVASLPEVEAFSDGVNKLVAHSAVPVNVCPATCFNLGSFQGEGAAARMQRVLASALATKQCGLRLQCRAALTLSPLPDSPHNARAARRRAARAVELRLQQRRHRRAARPVHAPVADAGARAGDAGAHGHGLPVAAHEHVGKLCTCTA